LWPNEKPERGLPFAESVPPNLRYRRRYERHQRVRPGLRFHPASGSVALGFSAGPTTSIGSRRKQHCGGTTYCGAQSSPPMPIGAWPVDRLPKASSQQQITGGPRSLPQLPSRPSKYVGRPRSPSISIDFGPVQETAVGCRPSPNGRLCSICRQALAWLVLPFQKLLMPSFQAGKRKFASKRIDSKVCLDYHHP
jgi:hypothetical protein